MEQKHVDNHEDDLKDVVLPQLDDVNTDPQKQTLELRSLHHRLALRFLAVDTPPLVGNAENPGDNIEKCQEQKQGKERQLVPFEAVCRVVGVKEQVGSYLAIQLHFEFDNDVAVSIMRWIVQIKLISNLREPQFVVSVGLEFFVNLA